MNEYPKVLYRATAVYPDWIAACAAITAKAVERVVVRDREEEEAYRADGYGHASALLADPAPAEVGVTDTAPVEAEPVAAPKKKRKK